MRLGSCRHASRCPRRPPAAHLGLPGCAVGAPAGRFVVVSARHDYPRCEGQCQLLLCACSNSSCSAPGSPGAEGDSGDSDEQHGDDAALAVRALQLACVQRLPPSQAEAVPADIIISTSGSDAPAAAAAAVVLGASGAVLIAEAALQDGDNLIMLPPSTLLSQASEAAAAVRSPRLLVAAVACAQPSCSASPAALVIKLLGAPAAAPAAPVQTERAAWDLQPDDLIRAGSVITITQAPEPETASVAACAASSNALLQSAGGPAVSTESGRSDAPEAGGGATKPAGAGVAKGAGRGMPALLKWGLRMLAVAGVLAVQVWARRAAA